ncbi:helix-turn-helix domain-containing protein [Sphingomonas montana]|uniref:helix-turn-helix domain-containing protein n=1 Tax=Sphingomonas montana TaxID=1843236 RepID=UPI00096F1811|nr:DUF4019 domain-containing protein [Sphingomonas montana]
MTRAGILTLTEREKETLRLLIAGHDAKSIARHFGLSVHTINERLRDARRKLDVSSSREAARFLAESEQALPDSLVDRALGVADGARPMRPLPDAGHPQAGGYRLVWFGGGMLIMSLLIAVVALSSAFYGNFTSGREGSPPVAAPANMSRSAGLGAARTWLSMLDRQDWNGSWRAAASLFKTQITAAQWGATIQSVRAPLGPVSSRTFQTVTKAGTLPGAPAGDYEVLQFRTDFASKPGAVETVTLARDRSAWKVVGYFIR